MDNSLCNLAAVTYGHGLHPSYKQDDEENHQQSSAVCILKQTAPIPHAEVISSFVDSQNELNLCYPQSTACECTPTTPCFCMTKYFVESSEAHHSHRRQTKVNGQFSVSWSLSLGGKEFLLQSAFLRAAFEQSIKDYINNDILCSDDLSVKGAEFFGIEIADNSDNKQRKWMAVSGTGKCKGDVKKCKVPIKAKRTLVKDDDVFDDDESNGRSSNFAKAIYSSNDFCQQFLSSTIFDAFEKRLLTASVFNYNVDVGVISDLQGSLDLKYDVSFEAAPSAGLDQVEDVDASPDDPVPISNICEESQCITQREVMRKIFEYFDLPFDKNKHECLYQGINCNTQDMVTHIWMGE